MKAAKPINILMVDDNEDDYYLTRKMLSKIADQNFALDWAPNFESAANVIKQNVHDVYLLDYRLGHRNGLELLEEVHKRGFHGPVILLTGYEDDKIDIEAMKAGADDYLVKGQIDSARLIRSIRYAVERKHFEQALAAEKQRLAVTLRSIGDGVITTDTEGKIISLNQAAEKITGWPEAQAMGKSLSEVFCIVDEKNRQSESPLNRALRFDETVQSAGRNILITKDHRERLIEHSCAPVRDENGGISGTVLVFRDITEKHKLEEEQLKASKLESIGILAGGIAHDFNNLLTGIRGYASLMKMDFKPGDESFERLSIIEKACSQAVNLTRQLLTFAKGGVSVKKPALIANLIKDSARFALRGSNVRCEYQIAKDLWPVEIDEGQISQVINNIIINANQAMPTGGKITISAQNVILDSEQLGQVEQNKYVKISIADQGSGIRKEHLSKIFDPYFTTKKLDNQKGSGLGLSTSYSIIKNHNGFIRVESELNKGSTFHIYLPASTRPWVARKKSLKPVKRGKGTILVMDDEKMIREILVYSLGKMGFAVTATKEGSEIVKAYEKALASNKPYDLVIMDLTVPGGMSGKQAIEELCKLDPNVKAIASSGYSTDPIMSNYKKYGFCGVISKPYDIHELNKVVHRVLTNSSPRILNPES